VIIAGRGAAMPLVALPGALSSRAISIDPLFIPAAAFSALHVVPDFEKSRTLPTTLAIDERLPCGLFPQLFGTLALGPGPGLLQGGQWRGSGWHFRCGNCRAARIHPDFLSVYGSRLLIAPVLAVYRDHVTAITT